MNGISLLLVPLAVSVSLPFVYIPFLFAGITSAFLYPCLIKILSNYFQNQKGVLLGLWAGCGNFGNNLNNLIFKI